MKFLKMHGIQNDYLYIDVHSSPELERRFEGDAGATLIRQMSHRHTGVGSDGVILVCKPSRASGTADVRMRMFNADGSESEMCGNGVRCVAKFAHDRLGVNSQPMRVETGRGVLKIEYATDAGKLVEATVDMGEPILEAEKVPVLLRPGGSASATVVDFDVKDVLAWNEADEAVAAAGIEARMTCVSMGNPHAVFFCQRVDLVPLERLGPMIERHEIFPRRVNAHFVQVTGRERGIMRTWERGAGATLACGTGACAVHVAGVLTGKFARASTLDLPGGSLAIRWDKISNHVFMTGTAEDVFEGEWPEG